MRSTCMTPPVPSKILGVFALTLTRAGLGRKWLFAAEKFSFGRKRVFPQDF
ncbi:unnamed protein product [Caretta caretta]